MRRTLLAAIALLLSPSSALASGADLFGFGARSAALGGTAAAVRGFEATHHNPAALADLRLRSLSVGIVGAHLDLAVDGEARPTHDPFAAVIGVGVPIPLLGWWDGRVGLGIGVWVPTDVVVAAEIPSQGTPWLPLLEQRARTVGVHGGVGVRLADSVSVGLGVVGLAALRGAIDVRPTTAGKLSATVENELIADYAPIAGVMVGEGLGPRVALVYRGESRADFDVPLDADLGDVACAGTLCLVLPTLRIEGNAQYDPAEVHLDVAQRLGSVLVSVGVTWKDWSAFPRPVEPPVPGSPPHPLPRFEDTLVPNLAAEWSSIERTWGAVLVRAGGWYEPSPAPDDARESVLVDPERFVGSVGVGVRLGDGGRGTVEIDAFAMVHGLVPREHATVDGPRTGSGRVLAGGLQAGVRF